MFESSQNVLLKPTESWRATLLDGRVMELFFTVSLTSSQREGRGAGSWRPRDGWTDGRALPRPPLLVGVAAQTGRAGTLGPAREARVATEGRTPERAAHSLAQAPGRVRLPWVPAVHTGNLEKQCVKSFKNSGTKPTSVTGSDADGRGAVPRTGARAARCEARKARRPARLGLCRRSRPHVCRAWTGRRGLRRGRRAAPHGDSPWTRPEQPVVPASAGGALCGRGPARHLHAVPIAEK